MLTYNNISPNDQCGPESVSSLIQRIKKNLEPCFSNINVEGEITNISSAANKGGRRVSSHWYFALKDPITGSQIDCVVFAYLTPYMNFEPTNGLKVIASGKISIYDKAGRMQLVINKLNLAGLGALELKFRQLKEQLDKEGLFDDSLKRTIPSFPKNIGVIASLGGLAINDIITQIKGSHFNGQVIIYPALVQGIDAPQSLINQIKAANYDEICDVLIIARGGGSYEDLFCFNDENLVRTLRKSNIPIISAIGHTEDESLCDYASDLRAATPTEAGALVAHYYRSSYDQLPSLEQWFQNTIQSIIGNHLNNLKLLDNQLLNASPSRYINSQLDQLKSIDLQLINNISQNLTNQKHNIEVSAQILNRYHPENKIQELKNKINVQHNIILGTITSKFDKFNLQLSSLTNNLKTVNPKIKFKEQVNLLSERFQVLRELILNQLEKHNKTLIKTSVEFNDLNPLISPRFIKSITQKDENVVTSVKEVKTGDRITTYLKDGKINSVVTEISELPGNNN